MAIVDRVKFDAPSDHLLVWKWPGEELRLGTQLIVNQSQEAIFVRGGQALDTFGPGTHTLSTGNLPLVGRLVNFAFGGQTPFTAEVWYVNKTAKRDLTWGTRSPIPLIDPEHGYPVNVRAYGQWGVRVEDSRSFVTQLVGTLSAADSATVEDYFAGEIVQRFSDALSKFVVEQHVSIFEANARLNDLSRVTADAVKPEFQRFGIEIVNFNVERVSIPEDEMRKFQEVEGERMRIDRVSKAQVGQAYVTMRTFDTLEKAAENEAGAAGPLFGAAVGAGLGLGAGVAAGQQVAGALTPTAPAGTSASADDPVARLQKLKAMRDAGLISQQEFEEKRRQILDSV